MRVHVRVGQQRVGERLEAGLAGDLRLGAPLGLERQVDVLQPRLRVGGHDLRPQRVVELALRGDRFEDGAPALLQLAQVAQPLLERAQLRVVERPGDLLAVPGDERHGGAAVEQVDGGLTCSPARRAPRRSCSSIDFTTTVRFPSTDNKPTAPAPA